MRNLQNPSGNRHHYYDALKIQGEFDMFLEEHKDAELEDEVRQFYFDVRNFLNIAELVDENYVIYAENGADGRFRLKLFCVNPAANLGEYLKKAAALCSFPQLFCR